MKKSYRLEEVKAIEESAPKVNVEISKLTVESVDNHIYFYSDVDEDRCLALIREIRLADARLRNEQVSRNVKHMTPIWIHIQSYGGSLFAALSVIDQIEDIQSPVYSVIEGICASAATLISMACDKTYILKNSFMLIHQLSTIMWGKHEEFKDEMMLQEKLMDTLVNFYSSKTGIADEEIREMLKRDYWMTASEAVEKNFVQSIWNSQEDS